MSGVEEYVLAYFNYELIQTEYSYISHRKSSFIDLLNVPLGIPDTLIDLQMDSMPNNWELPELNTQPSESEPLELNLEEIFDIDFTRKRPDAPLKHVVPHFEKTKNDLIGTLTVEQRKEKITKYLEKRKKRTWKKRIYYDCRKRVADNRLRIKGRFVTRDQAITILGPDHEAVKHLL